MAGKRPPADGRVSAADVILFHPREVEGMPVADVLTSQRHWGETRCRRLLVAAGVKESKPIGSMTERQRLMLSARLNACTSSPGTRAGRDSNGARQ